jgi:hypothetical protein
MHLYSEVKGYMHLYSAIGAIARVAIYIKAAIKLNMQDLEVLDL